MVARGGKVMKNSLLTNAQLKKAQRDDGFGILRH